LSVTSTFSWIFPAAGVEALAVVRTAARYGERLTTHGATLQVLARLRAQVFASATRMAPRQLRRFHSGDLLDRVQADIDSLDRAILAVAVPTVVAAIIGASGLAVPALIRPAFALVTGLALPRRSPESWSPAGGAGGLGETWPARGQPRGPGWWRCLTAGRRSPPTTPARAAWARGDVRLRGLAAGMGDNPALWIDKLDLPGGGLTLLTGASGAGKSTLLRVLAGAPQPMAGTVRIGGTGPHRLEYEDLVAGVTLVEQDSLLLSGTVADNLRLARGSPRGESSR
jgi:ABC-type transport system involved in cytochrome bd biosynthesis fused ATPase/permease subunit